jgi:hypothetical protein
MVSVFTSGAPKAKTPARPRWGLVRTHTARALGGRGAGKRPASVEFEPGSFLRLYQTAHSESIVDMWDNTQAALVRSVSGKPERVRFLSVPLYNAAASALDTQRTGILPSLFTFRDYR